MVSQYIWLAIAGGVFAAGIGIGYAIFSGAYNTSQQAAFTNQQQMLQYMQQNPQAMNQWTSTMMQNPATRQQMVNSMSQNQQFMQDMMGDPALRQQMMGYMMNNPQFMQEWMSNSQFQQNWVYPNMMQNWRMGPGMGPGMMGGPMMGYGVNASASPVVQTDKVVIPQGAWSTRNTTPYQPLRIEVQKGTTVTWTNNDSVVHTVTDVNNGFDSKLINPDGTWSYTFDTAGEYNYYCTIHPWMRGAVEVK